MNDLQKILTFEMEKRGLSMRSLALKAGLRDTYIKDIMSGKSTNPDVGKLIILARFLGRPLSDFIKDSQIYQESPYKPPAINIPDEFNPAREMYTDAILAAKEVVGDCPSRNKREYIVYLASRMCKIAETIPTKVVDTSLAMWVERVIEEENK